MLDKEVEYDFIINPIGKKVSQALATCRVMIDKGAVDNRACEKFQVFFSFPDSVGNNLNDNTVDCALALNSIANSGAAAIIERYGDLSTPTGGAAAPDGIGILVNSTSWQIGGSLDIPELEPMLNTIPKGNNLSGVYSFYVRFSNFPSQVVARCKSATPKDTTLPPSLSWE